MTEPRTAYRLPAQTRGGGSRLDGARVLVVSMYYRPETTGSAPYTVDLAEHLAAKGAHVRVVAAQPHYPTWRRAEGVPNALTVSQEDGVEVVRVPRRPTLLRRALFELAYASAARHHMRADETDLVLACTPALFAGWLGARAGMPCVTLAQDLITRMRTAPRIAGRRHGRRCRGGGWAGRAGSSSHTGNLGLKQGLEDLAPALHHLALAATGALVSFVGEGSRRLRLEAESAGLGSGELRNPVPAEEYPLLLDAADALLVHERSTVRDMRLPSKLTSYFTAGRPVLAVVRDDSATAAELATSGAGLLVRPSDPVASADRVAVLQSGPDLCARLGTAGIAYARRHLRPSVGLDGLSRLVEAVLRDSAMPRKAGV